MSHNVAALNAALKGAIIPDGNEGWKFSTTFIRFLNNLVNDQRINTGVAQPVTIASGVITLIAGFSYYKVSVESGSTDDLNKVANMNEGDLVFFKAASDTKTVIFKDGVTNILTDGSVDLSLNDLDDLIIGHYDGSNLKCFLLNIG